MDLVAIGMAVMALLLGGAGASWWWSSKLKKSAERIAKLDHAAQFAEQQNTQVRKQVELLQREVTDLRVQLSRTKPRQEVSTNDAAPTRQEVEDMLLRQPSPEAFPATQILPRQSPSDGFPTTQVLPRKR